MITLVSTLRIRHGSALATYRVGPARREGYRPAPHHDIQPQRTQECARCAERSGLLRAPIPEDARRRLFQPFYRGAAHSPSQGLGLGLYIAAEIAKAHGGTIEVNSSEAETRFTFRIPLEGNGSLRPG
jgi:light-regulated signal transduction histidine kinase (bacteriophytochrome)